MTKDEALDLALEALRMADELEEGCGVDFKKYGLKIDKDIRAKYATAITAIKQARSAPVQEPTNYVEYVETACALIKAADDAAADGDYMLDSDDCIAVLRGTWKGPMLNDMPQRPAPPTAQPAPVQEPYAWTSRELELIDGMIRVQLDHAERCDSIANRTMADKQKGWDMERVALLHKIRATPPAAQRQWVGLTDEEMLAVVHYSQLDNARAIEAKLKEKNT